MDFTEMIDLASKRLGARALSASDEFFAPKENLLEAGRGVFVADRYTENGKWMDGWETRRRRGPGHDWCVVRLGLPGVVYGVDVDTNHFLGNYPEHGSLEAASVEGDPDDAARWTEILPICALSGGAQNLFAVASRERWTHVRLHIYPDGGVARLRVYGRVVPDAAIFRAGTEIDLAAVENGGVAVLANDMFFSHRQNLLMPGRAENMGDGWETKRKRGPGNDWVIVRLGAPGTVRRIEVDTNHFKGNYPDSCSIEGCDVGDAQGALLTSRSIAWETILPRTKLQAHTRHFFEREIVSKGVHSHVRLSIYPDGGVSRLRVHGIPARAPSP